MAINGTSLEPRPRLPQRIYGWFDARLGITGVLKYPMPKSVNWSHTLGGLTFLLFGMQVVTGILLALYYRPSPGTAYESVRYVTNVTSYGWLIRGLHAWGATAMLIVLFAHMVRVFIYGAYKRPREMNWITGALLLFAALGFGFTGYLLPWDQIAYWATTVGTELTDAVPYIGHWLLVVMRGGEATTGETLARFYTAHTLILPLLAVLLLGVHFLVERKLGMTESPLEPDEDAGSHDKDDVSGREPFFPNHVLREGIGFCFVLGVLFLLVAFMPPHLEAKADPTTTPQHIKPEWYFLPSYQLLKLFPSTTSLKSVPVLGDFFGTGKTISVLLIGLAALGFLFLPFLDRKPGRQIYLRRGWLTTGAVAVIAVIGLGIWGHHSK